MGEEPRQGTGMIILTMLASLLLTILPLPDAVEALRPPWYALVLIYWCFALPERVGVGTGWLLGLMVDSLTGCLLGQHALALSLIAYLSITLHRRVRIFPLWQQSLTVLVLLSVERLLSLWINGAIGRPTPPLEYWVPALVGMFLWPWVFVILRDLRRRFRVS